MKKIPENIINIINVKTIEQLTPRLIANLTNKINEIIDYINKQEWNAADNRIEDEEWFNSPEEALAFYDEQMKKDTWL